MKTEGFLAEFILTGPEVVVLCSFVAKKNTTVDDLGWLHLIGGDLIAVDGFRLVRKHVSASSPPYVRLPPAPILRISGGKDISLQLHEEFVDVSCENLTTRIPIHPADNILEDRLSHLYPSSLPVYECAITTSVFGDFADLNGLDEIVMLRFYGPTNPIEFACSELRGLIMPASSSRKYIWRPWLKDTTDAVQKG